MSEDEQARRAKRELESAEAAEPDGPDGAEPADEAEALSETAHADAEGIGAAPDAMFNALWKRVLEAWDDDKPHQAALSYALDKQMLPEIAGRYRALLDDPDKGARAKKKIDGVVVAATQLLLATRTAPREKIPWQWTATVAAVFVLVITFLAFKLFFRH